MTQIVPLWSLIIGLSADPTISLPTQYVYREEPTPLEASIKESIGGHGIDLIRSASNSFEMNLIRIAEGIYLNREEIEKKYNQRHFQETVLPPKDELAWWVNQFDGVKIPGAITGEAIRYYLHVIRSLQKGDYSVCEGFHHKSSHFDYKAEVQYHSEFQFKEKYPSEFQHQEKRYNNVYVVKMQLAISTYMNMEAAMFFNKERVVIFSKDGSVLDILGDDGGTMTVS